MRKLISVAAALLVCGCAAPPVRDAAVPRQIDAALAGAVHQDTHVAPPEAVRQALLPPLRMMLPPKASQALSPRFDLVVNQAPAAQVFMGIVSGTPYSMLVHPEVHGRLTVNLKNVTLFEALNAIRDLYGYDYQVEGHRITVLPLTMQTRVFHVNYIPAQRRGASSIRVSSGSVMDNPYANNGVSGTGTALPGASGGTHTGDAGSHIETTSDNDFWRELTASLKTLVGTEGGRSVVTNPQSGVVVVRAMPAELRNVAAFLKATQLSVQREVILEAKIIEVDLNENYQAGINWAAFRQHGATLAGVGQLDANVVNNALQPGATASSALSSGLASLAGNAMGGATAAGLFGLAMQTNNFAALLAYLQQQGTVHVLSSPRIATINNQSAILKVGTDEFFPTALSNTTSLSAGATTSSPSVTLSPFFSGIALDVLPEIDESNNIILHIHPTVSQVDTVTRQINLGGNNLLSLPLAQSNISETDSIVRARDGQVVVIGGLMKRESRNSHSGLPGVSGDSLAGTLLSQTGRTSTKQELVILLKPTVVQGDEAWSQDLLASQQRIRSLQGGGE
jgi:MSHA biogenesis protein MshL